MADHLRHIVIIANVLNETLIRPEYHQQPHKFGQLKFKLKQ